LEFLNGEADFKLYKIHTEQEQVRSGKMAIILSNQGLEELLSPLGFVWAAAVSRMDVHIYLQGPAVRILKKGFVEKLNGFNSIFSGFARKGLRTIGHIPLRNKIMELKELGAKFYLCQPSMDHFKVKNSDLIFEEVIIAEYVTFLEVLKDADIRFFL
jgi:predicted peroxiredoxin